MKSRLFNMALALIVFLSLTEAPYTAEAAPASEEAAGNDTAYGQDTEFELDEELEKTLLRLEKEMSVFEITADQRKMAAENEGGTAAIAYLFETLSHNHRAV